MALTNLVLSIYLCQIYGPIGSAVGTSISLVLGNGIIINIFYHRYCNIDITYFWRQIFLLARGLVLPLLIGIVMETVIPTESLLIFIAKVAVYSLTYFVSMWLLGMNEYEKNLFVGTFNKIRR